MVLASSGLVGQTLSGRQSLATLPFAMMILSQVCATIPASMLMSKVGRRYGFIWGALIGLVGGLLATGAVLRGSFTLFCLGTMLIGVYAGCGQFYRFAAAEVASERYRSRAIAYVLAGGVLAALAGPNLANWTRRLLSVDFAGVYAGLIILYAVAAGVASLLNIPHTPTASLRQAGRPLFAIVRQKSYLVALLSAMVGYGTMNFIMIATPLAMKGHAHAFADTAVVIQWHLVGMFAPSFFSGQMITRFGVADMMLAGIALLALCVGINVSGTTLTHYLLGLLALGIGWNFVFVGATTLLTTTYTNEEKAKAQALNDFMVFGTVSLTSFSAGAVHQAYGWEMLNLGVLPFLAIATLAILWIRLSPSASTPQKYNEGDVC